MSYLRRTLISWEGVFTDAFLADSRKAYRICLMVLLVGTAVTTAAMISKGCAPLVEYPHDSIMLLDYGSRLLEGQRPHTDFYSPLGFVAYGMTALGIILVGPGGSALGVSYLLVFPIVICWAWLLSYVRLTSLPSMLFAAMAGLMLVAPFAMGSTPASTSYGMQYNRLGWSLVCLLAMQMLLPPQASPGPRRQLLEGLSAGFILAATAFLKINYFAVAVGIVLVGLILFRPSRRMLVMLMISGATVVCLGLAYLRFDISAIFADMQRLSGLQRLRSTLGRMERRIILSHETLLALAVLALLVGKRLLAYPGRSSSIWVRALLAAGALVGAGVFALSTNAQVVTIPLLAVASLLLVETYRRETMPGGTVIIGESATGRLRFLFCNLIMLVIIFGIMLPDVISIARFSLTRSSSAGAYKIQSDRFSSIVFVPEHYEEEPQQVLKLLVNWQNDGTRGIYRSSVCYAVAVNDGLGLLRRHVRPEDRLFLIDGWNPFTYALGLRHPKGDAAWWHYGRVVNESHCPQPQRVLKDVTLVLRPKLASEKTTEFMLQFYGPAVDASFERIDESDLYVLYRRKD